MVTFETMLKDTKAKNDKCRNGLKPRQHNSKFNQVFLSDNYDFETEIKQLENQTNHFHKTLKSKAANATNYLKSAQCIQRTTSKHLRKSLN